MSPPKSAGKSEDIRTGAAKALLKARADILKPALIPIYPLIH
jgi:hypothetical protein